MPEHTKKERAKRSNPLRAAAEKVMLSRGMRRMFAPKKRKKAKKRGNKAKREALGP